MKKNIAIQIKSLLIIFFIIIGNKGYCQFDEHASYVPPSPNASSILKYANTPVNMYTGVPSIEAKLHNLQARGGYTIPLVLAYHASGIKVQDVSSSVGLGWELSANCLISRVVRGLPDEGTNGYFGSSMGEKINHPLTTAAMDSIVANTADSEPDLFYYNINGVYGKFVFNKNGVPVLLTDNSIRILNTPFKKELGMNGWLLEDLQGNMFYLGTDPGCTETTQSTAYGEASNNFVQQYTSTWYLSKIVTANNIETINFNYDYGGPIKITYYRKQEKFRKKISTTFNKGIFFFGIPFSQPSVMSDVVVDSQDSWSNNTEILISNPKYLVSIVSTNQSAYFCYDTQNLRKDVPNGWNLNKIIIKDYKGESLKSFGLNYDYFYSAKDVDHLNDITSQTINTLVSMINSGVLQQYQIVQAQSQLTRVETLWQSIETLSDLDYVNSLNSIVAASFQPSQDSPDRYRIRLNSITLLPANNPSSSVQLYGFQYNNNVNLPPRYSRQMDHWGYYNNKIYGDFPGEGINQFGYPSGTIDSTSRLPDTGRTKANILQKITYETGAYKTFVTESNTVFNPSTKQNEITGGLRIQKIISAGDTQTKPITEAYTYVDDSGNSTGKLINLIPVYVYYIDHSETEISYTYLPQPTPGTTLPPSLSLPNFQGTADITGSVPQNTFNIESLAQAFYNLLAGGNSVTKVSYTPFIVRASTSFNELFDIDGNAVGYSKVTRQNMGQGKTVNTFTDIDDYPDYTNQLYVDNNFVAKARLSPNRVPYTPSTSYSMARGQLKQSLIYDINLNLVKKTTNTYLFNSLVDSVKGFRCAIGRINTVNGAYTSKNDSYFYVGNYYYISKQLLLIKTTDSSYVSGNPNPISTIYTYKYNTAFPSLISSQAVTNSDYSTDSISYNYVLNKDRVTYSKQSEIDAANQLFTDGKFGLILEKTNRINLKITQSNRIGYRKWIVNTNTLTLPETIYKNSGVNILPKVQYYSYDQYGDVLSSSNVLGAVESNQFNNNQLYLSAKTINANGNDVFYNGFEDGDGTSIIGDAKMGRYSYTGNSGTYTKLLNGLDNGNYTLSYWGKLNGVWSLQTNNNIVITNNTYTISLPGQIDDVRFYPSNSQMVTYGNDPFFGMTSETDVKNNSTYYEYDALQRLINIKDQYGNITKSYCYNYAGQPIPCSAISLPYFNNAQSSSYTSACNIGSFGSNVTYTVSAGTYSSTISQADADQQALNDVNLNGQNYANSVSHSACTPLFQLINNSSSGFTIYFTGNSNPTFSLPANTGLNVQVPAGSYTVAVAPSGTPVNKTIILGQRPTVVAPGNYFLNVIIGTGSTDSSLLIHN